MVTPRSSWFRGACVLSHFSCVWLFATLWTVACQAPLSTGFSRQEYWSGLPWPPPGDLPDPRIKSGLLCLLYCRQILYLLERETAAHSSTLAWKIPWMEKPDRLLSMGSQRFGQDWATKLPWWLRWQSVCRQCGRPEFDPWVRKIPWRRKWQPTPILLPGKFHGWRSLVGHSPWGCKELDTTERLHAWATKHSTAYTLSTKDSFPIQRHMQTESKVGRIRYSMQMKIKRKL